jgi:hypothetical protein
MNTLNDFSNKRRWCFSSRTRALIAVMAEIGDVLVVAQTNPKAVWVHNNKQHLIFKQNF